MASLSMSKACSLLEITLFFLSVIVEMTLDFMKLDAVVFPAGNPISFQHLL